MEISVVMPVYNCNEYLEEAIDSVLAQTFTDFELIIVDDGSTDDTVERILRYTDSRIRLLYNRHDFIASLNLGLYEAKGKYIARMDSDDIMMPERLEMQYKAMEEHPDIVVCSSWMRVFGENEKELSSISGYIANPLVQMLTGNIVAHPTIMLRKKFLTHHHLQYENYPYAEDYKLWTRIAECGGRFWMVPAFLLHYRISENQVSKKKYLEQRETTFLIQNEVLDYLLAHAPREKETIEKLGDLIYELNNKELLSEETCFKLFSELFIHIYR